MKSFLSALVPLFMVASCVTILGDDFTIVPEGGGATGGQGGVGGEGGEPLGGGGSTGDGPQLVGSLPADGATNASVVPFGQLFFDRPVNYLEATGKITVHTDGTPEVAQVEACPQGNPACVRFVMPVPLTVDALLPGNTTFTVTVDASFPDPDGNVNDTSSSVSYTTFDYDPHFYDAMITDDFAGIVYWDSPASIYVAGEGPLNNSGPDVIRVPLDASFMPLAASVVGSPNLFNAGTCSGGNSYVAHGLDRGYNSLLLSASVCAAVLDMEVMGDGSLIAPVEWSGTLLSAPDDILYHVDSAAKISSSGDRLYFGMGTQGSGPQMTGVIEYGELDLAAWELWIEKTGLFDSGPSFTIALGFDGADRMLYVASGDTIVKIRYSDRMEVNRHTVDGLLLQTPQLRVDSMGRLWQGTEDGLVVFDTTGFNGFTELARFEGLDMRRFDIREEDPVVHVYYGTYGGAGAIGTLAASF